MRLRYEDIVKKIRIEKGLSDDEIDIRIKKKLEKLSDLVTREGAAQIVANELGVKLFEDLDKRKLKINEMLTGMRNLSVDAKVVSFYGVREFKTEKRQGRVGNILVGDETGRVRVVIWDEKCINSIENLKEGDIVTIKGASVRDNSGFRELHLGTNSKVEINPKDVEIGEVKESSYNLEYTRKRIEDLNGDDVNVGVYGTVVQLFEPRFYEACPECSKKLILDDGKFRCGQHGVVTESIIPIVNLFFDDGTGNIRVVAFREQAGRILNMDESQMLSLRNNADFEKLKREVLGKQLIIVGNVNKNDMFDRIELVARRILELEPSKLISELESGKGMS